MRLLAHTTDKATIPLYGVFILDKISIVWYHKNVSKNNYR